MKSLLEYINEWKEDLGHQVVIIIGTPGCGKTYWMQHFGRQFFKTQGITMNGQELDIDHTLKLFQRIDFPNFCDRVIKFKTTAVTDPKTGRDVHSNDKAWNTFIQNEIKRYTELNKANKGLNTNIPTLEDIKYEFVAPWLTRYYNATKENKQEVFDKFVKAMYDEYFDDVFASDFSVRAEAKHEYKGDLVKKLNSGADVYAALSGAKFKAIKEIADICKEQNVTCRIVYLNGSIEKAVYQDSQRKRSGGRDFVIDYAQKIENVWNKLIDPNSEEYFKNNGIYNIYELTDTQAEDIKAHPNWQLVKIYK